MSVDVIPSVFEPPGSTLYHYTRLDTAIELILPTLRMRMNPFSKMRDPRESKHWGYEAPHWGDELTGMDPLEEIHLFAELLPLADAFKDQVKVLCLTQDDPAERDEQSAVFGRGFAHPRLWEHYADTHRGVCVCFDRETLARRLTHKLKRIGTVEHRPVEYVDREIAAEALRFLLEESRDLPPLEALHKHFDAHVDELFFTKLRDWETEAEYRFVIFTDDAEPLDVDVSNSLRALIIGADVSTHYLPALSALCDPKSIAIYRVQWQHGRPRLTDPRAFGYS